MADFLPFGAVHYNPEKFQKISDLVSPTADMVSENLQKKLMKDYYNFIHLIRPEGDDPYRTASHKLYGWLLRDVLVLDKEPVYYVHEEDIQLDGVDMVRMGVIGLLRLEEYGQNVKKVEVTVDRLVDDRQLMIKETQSNLETLFCLYKDQENQVVKTLKDAVAGQEPFLEMTDFDGQKHRIFRITSDEFKQAVREKLSDKSVYIVEGHHRYEAALKNKAVLQEALGEKYTGKEPFNFVMADFFNVYEPSLRVLPVNRVLKTQVANPAEVMKKLEPYYKIGAIQFNDMKMEKAAREKVRQLIAEARPKGQKVFGMYFRSVPNRYFILSLKDLSKVNALDVMMLDQTIIKGGFGINPDDTGEIVFESDDTAAFDLVKSGEGQAALFVNPVPARAVIDLADRAIQLPPKSTYFYPKVLSGITVYSYRYSKIQH